MGFDVLHRRCCHYDGTAWVDVDAFWAKEAFHCVRGRIYARLDAVWRRPEHRADGAVSSFAGRFRRGPRAAFAVRYAGCVPYRATRSGDGDLGHGRYAWPYYGPNARRLVDRDLELALGVFRQFAVWHHHGAWAFGHYGRNNCPQGRAL